MLGNVYLHYVLDLWFERDIQPRLKGHARLVRYCDDWVLGFARQDDARRVLEVLHKRMVKYGLTLHPERASGSAVITVTAASLLDVIIFLACAGSVSG